LKCRSCGKTDFVLFADLGFAPPSNSYLTIDTKSQMEAHFPLRVFVCSACYFVQTQDIADREIFFNHDYAYFSSFSRSWLNHCEKFVENILPKTKLAQDSLIIEVGSNDGYLLEIFKRRGLNVMGIEPTESTAKVARNKKINTLSNFFSSALARELVPKYGKADLMIGNNVLAHVPDINDFIAGFAILLKDNGLVTFEFPHLLNLIKFSQFDTIYHEHYSYLSLVALIPLFERHGLNLFDAEVLDTHGGSLRIYLSKSESGFEASKNVRRIISEEKEYGLEDLDTYRTFPLKYQAVKNELLEYLIKAKKSGKKIAAYGAAAKGNTLLNYCGIREDIVESVADANIHKQGKYLPGSCIPIVSLKNLVDSDPDVVIILPWNLSREIMELLVPELSSKTEYLVAIPKLFRIK